MFVPPLPLVGHSRPSSSSSPRQQPTNTTVSSTTNQGQAFSRASSSSRANYEHHHQQQQRQNNGIPEFASVEVESGLPTSTPTATNSSSSTILSLPDHLRSSEDLNKLSHLRARLLAEKQKIDAELNDGVVNQLEETREGLRKLGEVRSEIARLREEMKGIETVGLGEGMGKITGTTKPTRQLDGKREINQNQVTGEDTSEKNMDVDVQVFSKISKVATIHRNLTQTNQIIQNLRSMASKVHQLSILLESDKTQPLGPKGESPNLLIIHFQLNGLEAFRNETMHLAKKGSRSEDSSAPGGAYQEREDEQRRQDEMKTLMKWFERLDDLIREFEDWLWELGSNVLALVREGNGGTVVRLLKIIELESQEDQKAVAMRLVRKVAKGDSASKYRSMQANARIIKNYRHKFLDVLLASIKETFNQAEANSQGDHIAFLDKLGWIYQDFIRIKSDVVPLFPEDYDIYAYYVKKYHITLNETLQRIVDKVPEASVLLRMHAWIKEYRSSMKELEIPTEWLQPPLLNGKSQDLIEDYVKLIVTKIDEWSTNLMNTERRDFTKRDAPPEQDSAGLYGLQYAVMLFQMVNQQIDLAADSGQGAVLARVVSESVRVMKQTQQSWARILDMEYKKQIEKPDEVPPGLVEYVIALANDQLKSADYCEILSSRLEPLVSEKYKIVIVEKLNDSIDGYLDVAKKSTQVLVDLVFNDLNPVAKLLFTQHWYTDSLVEQIVETMRDYMADYQAHLNESIFGLLVDDLIVHYLSIYLNALRRVQPKSFRIPAAINRMVKDTNIVRDFFAQYKTVPEIDNEFDPIQSVISMLSASSEMIFMDYWAFAKRHGPNLPFAEAIIKGRDDLDKHTTSEVIETFRRKVREEEIGEPEEPTIMVSLLVLLYVCLVVCGCTLVS